MIEIMRDNNKHRREIKRDNNTHRREIKREREREIIPTKATSDAETALIRVNILACKKKKKIR